MLKSSPRVVLTVAFIIVSLCSSEVVAQRQMEGLGRGVVALRQADGKHAGFYVGEGMSKPPRPSIVLTKAKS